MARTIKDCSSLRESTLANLDRLQHFGIFWHNDRQEGFGIDVHGKEARRLLQHLEFCYQMFKSQSEAEREEFLTNVVPGQLLKAGKMHKEAVLSDHDNAVFLIYGPLNVYILEQEGRLSPVDEYNGCAFAYEFTGREVRP